MQQLLNAYRRISEAQTREQKAMGDSVILITPQKFKQLSCFFTKYWKLKVVNLQSVLMALCP